MVDDSYKFQGLRQQLVEELKAKGIYDVNTLNAIHKMPRHIFFDAALRNHAYQDKAFPIGEGQTISQPYTVAFQTQHLQISPGDKVLEIGTGSGYQSCILHLLGAKVFSIERQQKLFESTTVLLKQLKYPIKTFLGDGTKGLPNFAPFDKIIVTAGGDKLPVPLLDQLKVGGKLIIPIGSENNQEMFLYDKTDNNKVSRKKLGTFNFVPLIGKHGWS